MGAEKDAKQHGCPWVQVSNTLVGIGWAVSDTLCTNGLRTPSSHLVSPPFPTVKLFSLSG